MPEPSSSERSYSTPLKVLAGSAIGVVLAFGLCGAALASHGSEQMAEIALGVFGISALGLVVSVIWLIVIAITNSSKK